MLSRPAVISSAVCLAAIATFAPREVAACSCEASTLLSPRGGATDVPLNAVIIFQTYGSPGPLYDVTHGVEVPVTTEPFAGRPQTWLIRPNAALAANSIFEMAPGLSPGNPMAQFTTGTATDDAPPAYDGFRGFSANTINLLSPSLPCRSSCWEGNTHRRLYFDYAPPPSDSALLLAEIRREPAGGAPITETVPLFRHYYATEWPQRISNGSCFIGVPSFNASDDICVRVVAFDMAGHRSDASPEICSRAVGCAPKVDGSTCSFVDECVPEADPTSDAGSSDAASSDVGPSDDVAQADAEGKDGSRIDAPPLFPTVNNDMDDGCTISHGNLRGGSKISRFAVFAAALVLLRRRRRSD
jgi:hypothetical protein